jgi:amino acid transporter
LAPADSRTQEDTRMADETTDRDKTMDRDERKLAELGYKQELSRGWSQFSNFAISFSIISVLAGCFTVYSQAWNLGGPIAISWGWPLVALIILTVAFSMSELASAFPTAGGPYWWAHRLGGPGWSWFTGWFNVLGLIGIVASVDYVCAFFATQLFGLWGWDLGFVNFADDQHVLAEVFWVFVLILALHAAINIYSSHLVALFSNISVFWHVIGVAIIIAILVFVPDRHQSADFVFTERINNSGFPISMYWWYILPTGFLLTMYTITGYDASAHVAEETHEAEQAAAKGVWQSVASSALIGWFVLLAITFAATAVAAINDAAGTSISVFTSAEMNQNWAEIILLIATTGQLFCGMACVTSCSRTFYAFSRDRAVPGWRLWSRVSSKGVPTMAVLGSCLFAFLLTVPALPGKGAIVPPVAFFAVTSIGTIGLYIAYVAPTYLRWRAGEAFQQGSWNLGNKWKWMNPIAVGWTCLMVVVFCLPFYSTGVPWESDFDWNAFNYTPLVVGVVAVAITLAWFGGANKRYKGPIRTIEFDEGIGIAEEEPVEEEQPPTAPATP